MYKMHTGVNSSITRKVEPLEPDLFEQCIDYEEDKELDRLDN